VSGSVIQELFNSDPFLLERRAMVDDQLRRRNIRDERLLAVMEEVPRHEFIPEKDRALSYEDKPVPIGEGQTISQPYIVAAMIDALRVAPENTVLEIGTGTGYQAAVLSRLAAHVYTVERHAALAATAEHVFQQLGYANITVVVGDGSLGLPDRAPFDRIIVAAAAPAVPDPLLQQLGEGGRIIIPVGNPESQVLELVRKVQGEFITSRLEGVRFVPLIGQGGFSTRNF